MLLLPFLLKRTFGLCFDTDQTFNNNMQAGDARYTRPQTLAHDNFVTKWDGIKKIL
jgi:hypothetical protein